MVANELVYQKGITAMAVDDWVDFDDYWDSDVDWDEWGCQFGPPRQNKTCNHCGKGNLHWARVNGKWRLADGDNLHVCQASDEFPDDL